MMNQNSMNEDNKRLSSCNSFKNFNGEEYHLKIPLTTELERLLAVTWSNLCRFHFWPKATDQISFLIQNRRNLGPHCKGKALSFRMLHSWYATLLVYAGWSSLPRSFLSGNFRTLLTKFLTPDNRPSVLFFCVWMWEMKFGFKLSQIITIIIRKNG